MARRRKNENDDVFADDDYEPVGPYQVIWADELLAPRLLETPHLPLAVAALREARAPIVPGGVAAIRDATGTVVAGWLWYDLQRPRRVWCWAALTELYEQAMSDDGDAAFLSIITHPSLNDLEAP